MAADLHAGPDGFYRRGRGPAQDFRTASTLAPDLLADAFAALLARLPPGCAAEVVEVGAGTGALLAALAERVGESVALLGVEQRPRPPTLPSRVGWAATPPDRVRGLLLGVEWLDTVPVDVVVDGRVLEVAPDGTERTGATPGPRDAAWLARWWPGGSTPGARREVGRRRDEVWADAVARVECGVALAVDYGHRLPDRPDGGTLRAYAAGRQVPLRPGTTHDVTADVAWDAVQAAVAAAVPHGRTVLVEQRQALAELGLSAALPRRDDPDPARALQRAGRARLLLDPAGLGRFGWCATAVGVPAEVLPGRASLE